MTEGLGWSDNPTTVLTERVLRWLGDRPNSEDVFHTTDDIATDLDVPPDQVADVLDRLERAGQVHPFEATLEDTYTSSARVTSAGREAMRQQATSAAKRGPRVTSAANAMLSWLADHDGEDVSTPDFPGADQSFYFGAPFPASDVSDAADLVYAEGLMTGISTSDAGAYVRVTITPDGRDCAERFGCDVNAWRRRHESASSGEVSVNVDGSTGVTVAVHSPGARQSLKVKVTTDPGEQVRNLADAFEQAMPVLGLSQERTAQAEQVITELRVLAAEPEPDRGRIHRALVTVKEVAVQGTGAAVGTGIVALAEQMIQAMATH